jgi:hypothetical protein
MMPQLSFINVDVSTAPADTRENRRKVRSHVSKRNILEKKERKETEKTAPSLRNIQPREHILRPNPSSSDSEDDVKGRSRSKALQKRSAKVEKAAGSSIAKAAVTKRGAEESSTSSAVTIRQFPSSPGDQRIRRLLGTRKSSKLLFVSLEFLMLKHELPAVQMPIMRAMAHESAPHTGLHPWGKCAGPQHTWSPSVGIDEDSPMITAVRLYVISFTFDMISSSPNLSVDTLHYQGEAIRHIQNEVNDPSGKISNELILTMLSVGCIAVSVPLL